MKLTRTGFPLLIAVAALLVSIPAVVSAQGTDRPNRFSGNAFIDGQKAPPGTLIEALSGGTVVGTATVSVRSANINYILDVSRPSGGLALTFKVGGNAATQTATWQDGKVTYPFPLNASSDGDAVTPQFPPHAFGGQVTIDGNTASGGVEIAAIIEGGTVATAFTSGDGKYKLKVQQGTQNFASKTVTFTVDGNMASQLAIWRQGGVDLLDLSAYSGPRPVASVFATLISDGSLVAVWMYHNATQLWAVFDPRPEAAELNDLTEVNTKDIVWVEVSGQRVFQGRTLYQGWNLIAVR